MKVLLIVFLISSSMVLKSQDSINLIYLDSVLEVYRTSQLEADFENFEDLNKLTWLLFMPDVGYNFITSSPYLAYNSNSLFTYFNSKLKQKHQKKAMQKQAALDLEIDKIRLNRYYIQFNKLVEAFKFEYSDFSIYSKLYEIKKEKYEKDELSLENLMQSEIQFNAKKKALYVAESQIYDLILQIELLTHSSINYNMKN